MSKTDESSIFSYIYVISNYQGYLDVIEVTIGDSNLPGICSQQIDRRIITTVPFPEVKNGESLTNYQERLNNEAQGLVEKYSQYMASDFKQMSFITEKPAEPHEPYRAIRTRCCLTKLDNEFVTGIEVSLEELKNVQNPWQGRAKARTLASFALPQKELTESLEQYNLRLRDLALSKTIECIATALPNGLKDIRSVII